MTHTALNCLHWVKENHFLLRNPLVENKGGVGDTRVQLSPTGDTVMLQLIISLASRPITGMSEYFQPIICVQILLIINRITNNSTFSFRYLLIIGQTQNIFYVIYCYFGITMGRFESRRLLDLITSDFILQVKP